MGLVLASAIRGGEHWAASWYHRSKAREPDWLGHVVVDRLHATLHQVRFVPEAGSAGVLEERLPPQAVWFGARPRQQRIHVAPVLPHSDVQWKHGIDDRFMQQ